MGKKVKGKQRQDKYYYLAKEAGYRSRAAFKLAQLDSKFSFLPSAHAILDLCAAPGGWLQIAVQHAPVGSFVLGVDLVSIRPVRGALSLAADITTPKCRSKIKSLMAEKGCLAFDVVLHDGSPNIGGNWNPEATTQSALVIEAIRLTTKFLAPKGTFVTKIFRSQDYSAIIYCLKQLFEKVEVTKPAASRSTSAEIYAIGVKYKAPAKIDPRLLDMRHLFQGPVDRPKVVDVLKGSKQKRNREGYEDGNTTLWKKGLASEFIWSETPLEFLGSVNTISFEDLACLSIKVHELTTDEVKSLCEDLYVLDKHSFKHLLRWRMRLRKALSSTPKVAKKTADAENDTKGDDDELLLNQMEELTHAIERKKKRERKVVSKRRAKEKLRKATGMQTDATEDGYYEQDLFCLSSIKGKKDLVAISSTELNDDGDIGDGEGEETDDGCVEEEDSDAEQRRYDDHLEEVLDDVYERFMSRKGGSSIQRKRTKLAACNDAEMLEGEGMIHSDNDWDEDNADEEKNPLMIPLDEDEQPSKEQIMEKWFSQDVFAEVAVFTTKSDSENEIIPKAPRKKKASQEEGFEIVPTVAAASTDESEEEDQDDHYTKAEILSVAKKMLRKKQREQILDDAYNRYMFDDEALPKWFAEEEKRHCQPMKPVSKEEVAAMRAQFREIDARPAKKVAEAKARKKRAVMKKLEKVRQKESSITDQPDISERSKSKMINQLYKKAIPKRPQKEYVVAKKGVQVRPGKGKVLVDRRMKKDSRTHGMGKSKKGKGSEGKKKNKGSEKSPGVQKSPGKGRAGKGGKRGGKF